MGPFGAGRLGAGSSMQGQFVHGFSVGENLGAWTFLCTEIVTKCSRHFLIILYILIRQNDCNV